MNPGTDAHGRGAYAFVEAWEAVIPTRPCSSFQRVRFMSVWMVGQGCGWVC